MDIKTLREMKKTSDIGKLTDAFEKMSSKSYDDERIWKPTQDKAGNAYAIIRFLPAIGNDDLPFVKIFSHGFQNKENQQWYIENSLTTIGEDDPVSEYNTELWNTGVEANKDIARKQKRKLNYYSNILVVSDPSNPDNDGKVFLFRYGTKIFDKIMDMAQPLGSEDPVDVFDYWNGANFKLLMKKVDNFTNYDSSVFADPSPIGTDEEILEIAKQQHSLNELIDPKNFKSYDELKKRLDIVLGRGKAKSTRNDDDDAPFETSSESRQEVSEVINKKAVEKNNVDDDDDTWLNELKRQAMQQED